MIKKFFGILFILALLLLAGLYLFIPANIQTSNVVVIKTTENHAFTFLTNKKGWKKWWPGKPDTASLSYQYNGSAYSLQKFSNSGAVVIIDNSSHHILSEITFIAADKESVKVTWNTFEKSGLNPFSRISKYLQAGQIQSDISLLLLHLRTFLEDDRNIYHIDVKLTKVKDSLILTTKRTFTKYPTTAEIYKLAGTLKQTIMEQHAAQLDSPMLNVHQTGVAKYEVMVGIPISKAIKTVAPIFINKMVLGNILEADVTGGIKTLKTAVDALDNYRKDYNLISPAMPYQLLVTNRLTQPDTAKWITKLYYPIF